MKGARPPRPTGFTREALFDQWVWDTLTRGHKLLSSSTVKVSETSRGIHLQAARQRGGAAAPSGISVYQFANAVVGGALFGDYVLGYPQQADGTFDTSSPKRIAKPWKLRNSVTSDVQGGITYSFGSYGSDTCTRTVTWTYSGVNYTEAQRVVPPWSSAQLILVAAIPITGVLDPISGEDLGLIDLNINAMAWLRSV